MRGTLLSRAIWDFVSYLSIKKVSLHHPTQLSSQKEPVVLRLRHQILLHSVVHHPFYFSLIAPSTTPKCKDQC
jgi:hypothetical protein